MLDKSYIGLIFKSPRATREVRDTALRAAGAQWIVEVGKIPRTWREAVNAVREGDTVYVYALALVPTKRGEDELSPSTQVGDFLIEVHDRGGVVVEVYTGRKSNDRSQRRGMLKDAVKALRRGSRSLPPTGRKAGRPKTTWPSDEVKKKAIEIWNSPDFATRRAAEKNMPDGINSTLVRTLGKWPGASRKRKRKSK